MAVYEEVVSLKDGISGPAKAASGELNALQRALTVAQDKLTVASAMGNIKAYKSAAQDVGSLKAAISALPPAASSAASSAVNMGKALDTPKHSSGELAKAFGGAADAVRVGKEVIGAAIEGVKGAFTSLAAGDVQGALSSLTSGIAGIAKSLDLIVPGLGEVAAAAVTAAGGLASLAIGGMKTAIEVNQLDTKMRSMFDALGEGKISGDQVMGMLDGMSSSLNLTRDQLAPLAKEFLAMGVQSEDALKRMTTAALSAKAIMGDDSASQAYVTMARKIQAAGESGQALKVKLGELSKMGVDTNDVAKAMGVSAEQLGAQLKSGSIDAKKFGNALQDALIAKGAGPLADMGNELGNVWAKFGADMKKLFKGVDVKPFLKEVRELFSIFDATSDSGGVMKKAIGGAFTEIFAIATKVVPMVKHFLLDMVIYGLKAYIALKPIIGWFNDLMQNQTVMQAMSMAFDMLVGVVKVMAIGIGFAIVRFAVMAAAIGAVVVGILALVDTVVSFVADTLKTLGGWASSAATMASDFVKGLVNGITGDASAVVDAVTNLAGNAIAAFKGHMKSSSPSKVMLAQGSYVADGVAGGIQSGVPDVVAASTRMAKATIAPVEAIAAPKINAPSLNAAMPDRIGPAAAAEARGPAIDFTPAAAPAPQVSVVQAPSGDGGKGVTVHIERVEINGANKSLDDISLEALSAAFEQAAMHAGTG